MVESGVNMCKVVAQLVAGKKLRSSEVKFEVTESKLSLLLKHWNEMLCLSRNSREYLLCTYNHFAIN